MVVSLRYETPRPKAACLYTTMNQFLMCSHESAFYDGLNIPMLVLTIFARVERTTFKISIAGVWTMTFVIHIQTLDN